jgi:prepilin-type N-terminal cleavage/methylation domain-containing protein
MRQPEFQPEPRIESRGFTIIELMVSVAILVIVILSVGIIFQSASKAVGVSQSTMVMLSDTNASQGQFQRDVSGIDKNGFIVIRSVLDATTKRRFDQLSFVAYGSFPNRTGLYSTTSPFTDSLVSAAALVWYGQLVIQSTSQPAGGNYLAPDQTAAVALNSSPSGVNDGDFILGRHTTLLVSPSGSTTPNLYSNGGSTYRGFSGCQWNTPPVLGASSETASQISCSRVDLALLSPGVLEQSIIDYITQNSRTGAGATYEADNFCYRFACLRSPYDSEPAVGTGAAAIYNGYFRMHPIMLEGVSSFAVDWTDGTSTAAGLTWYGLGNPKPDTAIEPSAPSNGDGYQAIFSFDNRPKWPKALRIRYHVADPTGRLIGGRDFVQVANLPS